MSYIASFIISRMGRLSKIDLFSPMFIFPGVYILYFIFGYIRLTNLSSPTLRSLLIAFVGLFFYFLGVFISFKASKKAGSTYRKSLIQTAILSKALNWLILVSIISIIISIIIESIYYGIPILNPVIRGGSSAQLSIKPVIFASFILSPFFLNLYLSEKLAMGICRFNKALYIICIFFFGAITALFTAYRTPLVCFLLTFLFVFHYIIKRLSILQFIAFWILLLIGIISLYTYRLNRVYQSKNITRYFSSINPNDYPDFLISTQIHFREGATVFSDLINISSTTGLYHGEFYKASFATLLPGVQIGPGTLISLLRETNLVSSTTPSILGGPYLDFGIFGVIGFMFLIGLMLGMIFKITQLPSCNHFHQAFNITSYSFLSANLLISIHTGLMDALEIIFLLLIILTFCLVNYCRLTRNLFYVTCIFLIIIELVIITSYFSPSVLNEESTAIKYCQNTIDKEKNIAIDKHIAITAITATDFRFKALYSLGKYNSKELFEKGLVNEFKYLLIHKYSYPYTRDTNELPEGAGFNRIYDNKNTKLYDLIFVR